MNLEVTFRNLGPRQEVRKRAEALFAKLDKFLDPAAEAHLIVTIEHHVPTVEMVLTTRGMTHKAVENHEDLRTALDRVFHRIEVQLRRAKERRIDLARRREPEEPEVSGSPEVDADEIVVET